MLSLDSYINDLLREYDCVIVPQLGGFVTNYRPARIDKKAGVAHPPAKDLRFNKNLTRSDGTLENLIARELGLSFKQAGDEVAQAVETCWSLLHKGEKVSFEKVGVLYIDEHRSLRFEPSQRENFLKNAFGLRTVLLPQKMLSTLQNPSTEAEPTPVIPLDEPSKLSSGNRNVYWVAAAALSPFVALGLYLGLATDFKSPTRISAAELWPLHGEQVQASYEPRSSVTDTVSDTGHANYLDSLLRTSDKPFRYSFAADSGDSTGVWINPQSAAKASAVSTDTKGEATGISPGTYHIVAGCFAHQANARELLAQLRRQGFAGSRILDQHKGLYRVVLESYQSYPVALRELERLRSTTYSRAWMLKKPHA